MQNLWYPDVYTGGHISVLNKPTKQDTNESTRYIDLLATDPGNWTIRILVSSNRYFTTKDFKNKVLLRVYSEKIRPSA